MDLQKSAFSLWTAIAVGVCAVSVSFMTTAQAQAQEKKKKSVKTETTQGKPAQASEGETKAGQQTKEASETAEKPATDTTSTQAETATAPATAPDTATEEGLFGPVTFGPTFTGAAIPHPLNVGIETKFKDIAGLTFMYGVMPEISFSSAKLKLDSWDLRGRWFPFFGSFFLGAAYGRQSVKASRTEVVATVNTTTTIDVATTYLTPHIGWRWGGNTGFFWGMELGWQMAMNASTTLTTDPNSPAVTSTPEYQQLEADVRKVGNDVGNTGLPHVTLIHFGWLF